MTATKVIQDHKHKRLLKESETKKTDVRSMSSTLIISAGSGSPGRARGIRIVIKGLAKARRSIQIAMGDQLEEGMDGIVGGV